MADSAMSAGVQDFLKLQSASTNNHWIRSIMLQFMTTVSTAALAAACLLALTAGAHALVNAGAADAAAGSSAVRRLQAALDHTADDAVMREVRVLPSGAGAGVGCAGSVSTPAAESSVPLQGPGSI